MIFLFIQTERGDSCQTALGEIGVCIHFSECGSAIQEVKNRGYPEICSFDGLFPIVCCLNGSTTQFLTIQALNRGSATATNNNNEQFSQRIQDDTGVASREGSNGASSGTSLPLNKGNLSLNSK